MTHHQSIDASNKPTEVPAALPNPALPDADWADAFEIMTERPFTNARHIAEQTLGSMPGWASRMLAVRNTIVRPFGLTTDGGDAAPAGRIGTFPIITETADQIIVGFNDRHLDFRVIVERYRHESTHQTIRATTLVKRHNAFGRIYLTVITPFHKAIVATLMRQAL